MKSIGQEIDRTSKFTAQAATGLEREDKRFSFHRTSQHAILILLILETDL